MTLKNLKLLFRTRRNSWRRCHHSELEGELGQSSIFYSDDDATDSAFKAARQVGYSGNGFGKPHRFPAAWAVWDVRIGSRDFHECLVARNRVWSFDVDQVDTRRPANGERQEARRSRSTALLLLFGSLGGKHV